MGDDVVVALEDAVREPVVAHELPDVLDRIELGRARRRGQDGDVSRDDERNQIRGLLRERGLVVPTGRLRFERYLRERLLEAGADLSPVSRTLFATLISEYGTLDARISEIDRELEAFARSNSVCRALLPIPGIGVIVATALFSAAADVGDFRSGRDLAAFLGLVPRQRSAGGKSVLLGISKRGHTYVRTMLIHGMRSVFYNRQKRSNRLTTFMDRLAERGMHTNKIVVASANKVTRIVWAVLSRNQAFQPVVA